MALFAVNLPPRDFAIGDTWAAMYPSVGLGSRIDVPSDCIICGAKGNNCTEESHYGRTEPIASEADERAPGAGAEAA